MTTDFSKPGKKKKVYRLDFDFSQVYGQELNEMLTLHVRNIRARHKEHKNNGGTPNEFQQIRGRLWDEFMEKFIALRQKHGVPDEYETAEETKEIDAALAQHNEDIHRHYDEHKANGGTAENFEPIRKRLWVEFKKKLIILRQKHIVPDERRTTENNN